ncbi:peptidylprolyl isomerase [Longimicrobium terrae]|uniref:peptidylprolyl isomerase n=1 Tax=Longimicrobium terrae TaxID=1639882 RepID=A0A841GZU4_9BACT|nr:peptidylprolyl isomerase [Longimicrobium terrae]MBB4636729.1 cyclophilin family peptidyl-prolyl cis-trans isomerase [Longimicrobium terrae]MBB6071272.1 cyclophilin family peptidyl-prolyl cis-trans isomerase [Longimicrobium terrae]NNC29318.1 peptidylprolyl isomerase [Longimicrobium terrae]
MKNTWILALLLAAAPAQAQTRADSALVGRILAAEDRRDSTNAALSAGMQSAEPRVRVIARRAAQRIRDPNFAARDSFPAAAPSRAWPEPAWRLRYRALAERKDDCGAIRMALADSVWQVRLRAADVAGAGCGADSAVVRVLAGWVDELPRDTGRRSSGGVSWHAAAHAQVALARIAPAVARERLPRLASHADWHVRLFAARAAAVLADTARLRAFARDADGNVREAAIDALSKLAGHGADDVYLAALDGTDAQAVRAAAVALKDSPLPAARMAANAAYDRWVRRANASERDVRVALLEAAGRPASDDRPRSARVDLPADAVALALGREVRVRVSMSPSAGGGSFVVRLRGDVAPVMSARVLGLVQSGYYDGGSWHRVEPDFVIQGGGPGTNEYVGYAHYLRDELSTIAHPRGTVGMSTRSHDTGDAQWFINLKNNPSLVREYSIFAEVIEGIDVVDGILEGDIVSTMRVEPAAR